MKSDILQYIIYFIKFVAGMVFLYGLSFFLGVRLKAYFSHARIDQFLSNRKSIWGNFIAALFGAVTPFCSCTTIPIFAGMLKSNIQLGYAMSFLIASPTVSPPAIVLLLTLFGWQVTVSYIASVFFASIIGGKILGQRKFSDYILQIAIFDPDLSGVTLKQVIQGYGQFLRKFIFFILFVAVIATLLRSWVPSESLVMKIANHHYAAVPASTILGAFIYTDLMLILPIAHTLLQKGIPYGTVFAFTMAASGIGLPSLLLLSRLLKKKLIFYYLFVLLAMLIALGFLFNLLPANA